VLCYKLSVMNIALDQEKSTLKEYVNAPVGNNAKLINRTAVVRDPYARWGGHIITHKHDSLRP
jgi:hypothetical protein